jgi:hypothetical protein
MNSLRPTRPARAAWPTKAIAGLALLTLLAVLVAFPAAPAVAEPTIGPARTAAAALALDRKIIDEAKHGSEIMTNLTYLSDVIGPRLTGSPNLRRANDWAAERMRAYGLSNVHLEGWSVPVGWERGTTSVRLVEPANNRPLLAAAMGWTPGTNGPIVGDVVVVKGRTVADMAPYKGKLKGAIVLRGEPSTIRPVTEQNIFGGPGPGRNGRGGRGGDGRGGQGRDGRGGPGRDGRGGAGGGRPADFQAMMNARREAEDFLRNEGVAVLLMDANKPHGLLTMTGNWRGEDRVSGQDPLPTLFMAHEHYALLYRLATRPAPAKTRVEVAVTNKFVPGPIAVYNVVGEIRGSEKSDEYVVLGAHLDSWDLAQGTTDNGTGTCVVLEAARIVAKSGVRPKRTIRFVLFTGEEQGLHGSRAYVKQHESEMPRTSMALVHDTGTGKVIGIGLQGRAVLKPILEAELVSLKDMGVSDINLRGMGGSDHASFERAGVPGFAVQQDPAEYRMTHHSQSDTLDKAREGDLIQGAQVLAVTGLRVANLPNLLPRDKPQQQGPGRGPADRPTASPAGKAPEGKTAGSGR